MNHELNPHEPVNVHGITLGDSYWKFAVELGRGNASRGIREALYRVSLSDGREIRTPDTGENNEVRLF